MKGEELAEVINTILRALGILSVFFAGYFLTSWFMISVFLFLCGVVVLNVRIEFEEEGDTTE